MGFHNNANTYGKVQRQTDWASSTSSARISINDIFFIFGWCSIATNRYQVYQVFTDFIDFLFGNIC